MINCRSRCAGSEARSAASFTLCSKHGSGIGPGAMERQTRPFPHRVYSLVNSCVTLEELLTSLGLKFYIYKTGMIRAPASSGPVGLKKALNLLSG